jgi:hypothetical protein
MLEIIGIIAIVVVALSAHRAELRMNKEDKS